jgi:hypothetical protein
MQQALANWGNVEGEETAHLIAAGTNGRGIKVPSASGADRATRRHHTSEDHLKARFTA